MRAPALFRINIWRRMLLFELRHAGPQAAVLLRSQVATLESVETVTTCRRSALPCPCRRSMTRKRSA